MYTQLVHSFANHYKSNKKMTELDSKSETSLEGDTILSKLGKLTTANSPRVR